MMLPPIGAGGVAGQDVARLERRHALTSAGTSTCLVKKNGRLRANAVCTL